MDSAAIVLAPDMCRDWSLFPLRRSEPRELGIKDLKDIGHKLGILKHNTRFVLCPQAEDFPLKYRHATRLDAKMYKEFMWEVVPPGETAFLDDGWVDSGYLQCQTG